MKINQEQKNNLQVLPVRVEHVLALQQLPMVHKDPFDRLIIAVALAENAVLVSGDGVFRQYPVPLVW